jgi:hypothetical protein
MKKTIDVSIPVDPHAAAVLRGARNRKVIGRLVSRVLRAGSSPSDLASAIARIKAEARAAGLTDADVESELATYNAEQLDPRGKR